MKHEGNPSKNMYITDLMYWIASGKQIMHQQDMTDPQVHCHNMYKYYFYKDSKII